MTITCCGKPDKIAELKALGITEIELPVNWLYELSDAELAELKKTLAASGMNAMVCNCLMHSSVTPLFKAGGSAEYTAYLRGIVPKLQGLGFKAIVFGCGGFRRVPEGTPEDEIKRRLSQFLRDLCAIAAEHGITIFIEPLNKRETNVINTSEQAMEYINALKIANLRLLVDLYHFELEGESVENIIKFAGHISHIHIANPVTRKFPRRDDDYDYRPFLGALKQIGYKGFIAIEAGATDFSADLAEAIRLLS